MPELRIILLVVGLLFVAAIAGFEWWRARGQRLASAAASPGIGRDDRRGSARDERGARDEQRGSSRTAATAEDDAATARAPDRGDRSELKPLPEINVVREPRLSVPDSLPVIELASTSESGTRRALGISISKGISISNDVAVDVPQEDVPATAQIGRAEPYIAQGDEISAARVVPDSVPTVGAPKLTLAWPAEAERRIVTLRVIPTLEPRFPGRALRQAFGGCGFWHGPMDIYHLPDEQGRVLLSAAALAQPGTFDPSIMDSQRFSGLNLFAVLPGPLPEREVFDELVHAARQLADRLGGQITDQHGEELTAERIVRLRQSIETSAPATRAGQA
jgi:cell division protein ZipA